MAAHAKKSASGSKRWMGCPGSLALNDTLPPELRSKTNEAAMTGTCAHGLGEYLLRIGERDLDESLWEGRVIWLDQNEDAFIDGICLGDNWEYDEEDCKLYECEKPSHISAAIGVDCKFMVKVDAQMMDGVQLYLDTVWGDYDEMGKGTEMFVEKRMDLTWLRPDMFGTSDCTLYQFMGLLRVIDYKNGFVPVDAKDNSQGKYYALGAAHDCDWCFEDVEIVIVQPNSRDGVQIKRFEISKAELEEFRDELAAAADQVDQAYANLNEHKQDFEEWADQFLDPGENGRNCDWCDAMATCPAALKRAEEIALHDFFEDEVPDENEVQVTDGKELERLEAILNWSDFLDGLIKAASTLGQRRLEQGLDVPGYKLVSGRTLRQYQVDEKEVVKRMRKLGFKTADLYKQPPRKLLTPAQMEKLGKGEERKAAKLAVNGHAVEGENGEMVWEVEPLAIKPETGKLALAPLSDPREEVSLATAADDFEGIDE